MIIFGFLPFSKPPLGAKFSTILSGRFCQCHLPRTFSIIKQRRLSPLACIEQSHSLHCFALYSGFIFYDVAGRISEFKFGLPYYVSIVLAVINPDFQPKLLMDCEGGKPRPLIDNSSVTLKRKTFSKLIIQLLGIQKRNLTIVSLTKT